MERIALVEQAKSGYQEAISELYQETHNRVYYTALSILKNEQDALDAVQDSYIQAFQHIDSLQDDGAFEGWLVRIVTNRCKDILRKKKPLLFQSTDEENMVITSLEEENVDFLPQEYIDNATNRSQLMEIINGLSESQRTTILLFYYNELSVKEIAQFMDCSESTVTSRIFYAKKNIKTAVEILARQGDKLYTLLPISVLTQLFRQDSQLHTLSKQAAQELFTGIVATVSGIVGGAAAATGTATAANATGAAASKGGLMAKFSALSTSTKVAAAGVAAAVTVAAVAIPIVFPSDYVVEWADPAFEAVIRVAIDRPDGDIKRSELDGITSLTINGLEYIPPNQGYSILPFERPGQIESLEDLKHFKALKALNCNSQANLDLSTIPDKEALSSLKRLQLGECGLTDASVLSKLTNLKVLTLHQNDLSDFTFISELHQLEHLGVSMNKAFKSENTLENLNKLRYLDAGFMQYVDMDIISRGRYTALFFYLENYRDSISYQKLVI